MIINTIYYYIPSQSGASATKRGDFKGDSKGSFKKDFKRDLELDTEVVGLFLIVSDLSVATHGHVSSLIEVSLAVHGA